MKTKKLAIDERQSSAKISTEVQFVENVDVTNMDLCVPGLFYILHIILILSNGVVYVDLYRVLGIVYLNQL